MQVRELNLLIMKHRRAIWSKYHWLPSVSINIIYFIWFDLASSLSQNLVIRIVLIQVAHRILSLCLLSDFITWKECAYFNRFIPLRYYKCFTLFWSLIFWFLYTFTRHWFIGAILSWQNQRHFVILFQNIIISTSSSVCGISGSPNWLNAGPIFGWNTVLFFILTLIID